MTELLKLVREASEKSTTVNSTCKTPFEAEYVGDSKPFSNSRGSSNQICYLLSKRRPHFAPGMLNSLHSVALSEDRPLYWRKENVAIGKYTLRDDVTVRDAMQR